MGAGTSGAPAGGGVAGRAGAHGGAGMGADTGTFAQVPSLSGASSALHDLSRRDTPADASERPQPIHEVFCVRFDRAAIHPHHALGNRRVGCDAAASVELELFEQVRELVC